MLCAFLLIIKCPKCGTEKIYKPNHLDKIPKKPRSRCSKCGYFIVVPLDELREAIERKTEKEACDFIQEIGSKKKGKKNRSSPSTFVPAEPKRSHDKSPSVEFSEMDDIEILHYQYRKRVDALNPDRVDLDSFRQFLKERGSFEKDKDGYRQIPLYDRPEWLSPTQMMAMDMMDLGHLLWQASKQQTFIGKTTATFMKDCEDCILNANQTVALVAPGIDLAWDLIIKCLYTPIVYKDKDGNEQQFVLMDFLKPYLIAVPSKKRGLRFYNNSALVIISLNKSTAQGRTINVIHIEELDKLGSEKAKREALAGVIYSLRSFKRAKIRICCNNSAGEYYIIREALYEFGMNFPIFSEKPFLPGEQSQGCEIINEEVLYEKSLTIDEILTVFGKALVSEEFVKRLLYNIDTYGDSTLNPEKILRAFARGKSFDESSVIFKKNVMGIDSGGGAQSKTAVSVWGLTNKGDIVLRWLRLFSSADHIKDVQALEIGKAYVRFKCIGCQSESSNGIMMYMSLLEDAIYKESEGKMRMIYTYINFAGENSILAKNNFVTMLQILLDFESLVLFERDEYEATLKSQLIRFNSKKNETTEDSDSVDSSMHGIWKLVGGFKAVKLLVETQDKTILLRV